MKRLQHVVDDLNVMWFNPVGLNILWPGDVAFLFVRQSHSTFGIAEWANVCGFPFTA